MKDLDPLPPRNVPTWSTRLDVSLGTTENTTLIVNTS